MKVILQSTYNGDHSTSVLYQANNRITYVHAFIYVLFAMLAAQLHSSQFIKPKTRLAYASLPASSIKWPSEGYQKDYHIPQRSQSRLTWPIKGWIWADQAYCNAKANIWLHFFFVSESKSKDRKKLNYT